MVANVRVDRVGKVDRRGTARQREDFRLRREHVDRVGKQVDLDVLQELACIACLVLDVDEGLQPQGAQTLRFLRLRIAAGVALVHPVRRNAFLGHGVHRFGADLELNRRAQGAHQRGVQRLIAVGLRNGDVVLEAPGHRLVELVQLAER